MPVSKKIYSFLAAALLFASIAGKGYCFDDGFGSAKKVVGKHFTVFYASSIEPASLAMKLDVRMQDVLQTDEVAGGSLTGMLDALFSRVCDILDMHLYSYEGTVKICANADQLSSIFERMFGRKTTAPSFYVSELNTIYVDQENFTKWVVGHEMGHAIMSHYFVVPPPEKVSEVLSGYVEYQLRKQ